MDKPTVVLFDFDGTLTIDDTLPLYMRHVTGRWGQFCSFVSNLPAMIVLACAGWKSVWGIDAQTTKEKLLHRCFAGKSIEEVDFDARFFKGTIQRAIAVGVHAQMLKYISESVEVAIVTASPEVWVKPWAEVMGVKTVIGTKLEIVDDKYTGRFVGKNCNGQEKVTRIASLYPRSQYHIIAYGNSSGDIPMLRYAHEAYMCHKGEIKAYNHDK